MSDILHINIITYDVATNNFDILCGRLDSEIMCIYSEKNDGKYDSVLYDEGT